MKLRICTMLGCTLEELGKRMSAKEFSLWCVYYRLEPWGSELAQFNTGIMAATVANCRQGRKGKSASPSDFMPYAKRIEKLKLKGQTAADMESLLRGIAKVNPHVKITEPESNG